MKKFILPILLFLMFIPFVVNAETCDTDKITINSITVENKSDNVEELETATASGKNISLNLSMSEVGDNIEYKFVVKNDSSEDYELDKTRLNINSDYINYSFETDDNSNVVKANSTKNVTLRVEYKNEVPEDKFESDSYIDNKTISFQLSNGNTINVPDIIKNPNTGVQSYIFIILILLLLSGSLYILLRKKKYTKFMILMVGTAIIIPLSVYAMCKSNINISFVIEITKPTKCFSFAEDNWKTISNNIKKGNDSCYKIGDTKIIDMEQFGTHTLRIANKSTPNECSNPNYSQTVCGFVVEFEDIISMNIMNNSTTNSGGYENVEMRSYLNETVYNSLPFDLREVIINTKTVSGHNELESNNYITDDKLFILAMPEVFDYSIYTYTGLVSEKNYTRQLDIYKQHNVNDISYEFAYKKYNNRNEEWWLRTISPNGFMLQCIWGRFTTGHIPNQLGGVSPAFRIG